MSEENKLDGERLETEEREDRQKQRWSNFRRQEEELSKEGY